MSSHTVTVRWCRDAARFSGGDYSRAHTWTFDGGVEVPASSSPQIVPLPRSVERAVDPEEAFVAAVSSCHMLWFLSLAERRGWIVDRYVDEAQGTMARNAQGRLSITTVVLRPRVLYGALRPTGDEELALHRLAHEACFIANSIHSEIRIEPRRDVLE